MHLATAMRIFYRMKMEFSSQFGFSKSISSNVMMF